ncbi:MAG TPA: AMP-binding protein [Thermomonospora sp.]|nr:AMP-binding protein [Thermomonospora sp.]
MRSRTGTWTGTARGALRAARNAGMLTPVRPDRALRIPLQFRRFGPTPAAIGAVAALRRPGGTALIDDRGPMTYEDLERHARALASTLAERLAGDVPIGILCRNHRGFVQALLAASRLGTDVVPLNTDFSARQLGEVLRREGVDLLVHDAEFGDVVEASSFTGDRIVTDELQDVVAATEPVAPKPHRHSRIVVLTSGTTGTPQGARTEPSPLMLARSSLSHLARVPLRSGEPMVIAPPLFHVLGLGYLTMGMGLGMPLVLSRRFDPVAVLEAIERHRAQALVAVPVMLQRILRARTSENLDSLEVVVSGGSALHPHLSTTFMDTFGDILHNVYGATETGWASIATPEDLRAAPGTVGHPAHGLTVRVLDGDGRVTPPGETGEIHTSGAIRFTGYTGGGRKPVRDGLVGTGDLGHFDAAGRLFVDGRADDMIVSGGENVFPGEVEDVLSGHPAVAEVAVTGVDDAEFGRRLAAYVVLADGGEVTADALKAHVKQNLARYKVPRDVHFVTALPRTTTGKVRKRDLAPPPGR